MKVDFNNDSIKSVKLNLLEGEVDLILRSLEMYAYIYRFAYPRRGKYESKEEDLRISRIINTYEQISIQYNSNQKYKNIHTDMVFEELKNRIA